MSIPARRIHEFVPPSAPPSATAQPVGEAPKFVGHLLEMPLTNGESAMIDPDEVISVSAHRQEANVTVLRQRDDKFTYFINRPYGLVKQWIEQALDD